MNIKRIICGIIVCIYLIICCACMAKCCVESGVESTQEVSEFFVSNCPEEAPSAVEELGKDKPLDIPDISAVEDTSRELMGKSDDLVFSCIFDETSSMSQRWLFKKYLNTDVKQEVKIEYPKEFIYYKEYYDAVDKKYYNVKLPKEYQVKVFNYCKKYNVPYNIIMGLMGVETGWRYDIGQKGRYYGIGMLHVEYTKNKLKEAGINLFSIDGSMEGVCLVFSEKLKAFNGDVNKAILAYNQGNNGARMYIAENGTALSGYVKKVLMIANSLQ